MEGSLVGLEGELGQGSLLQMSTPAQQSTAASSVQDTPGSSTFKLLVRPLPTPEPQLHPDPFTSPSPPSLLCPSTPGCPSPFAHTVLSLSSLGPQRVLLRTGGNREWGRKGHIWIPGLKPPPPSQPSLPQKLTLTSARDDFLALLTPVHAFAKTAPEPL